MQGSLPLRSPFPVAKVGQTTQLALIPDSDDEDEAIERELRFFNNLGTPTLLHSRSRRQNASQMPAKEGSGSRASVVSLQQVKVESQADPPSPALKKRKRRKAAIKAKEVKQERANAETIPPEPEVFGRERWLDLDQSTPEYPEGPDDEPSRRLWIERTRLKRRVKLQKEKEETAKNSG